MVASFDALITRTPTSPSSLSACSILTRSCALAVDAGQGAGQLVERGVDVALLLAGRPGRAGRAPRWRRRCLALLSSRLPVKVSIWLSTERDVVLAAGQGLVELLGDGLHLGHAAAVEQQAQRPEDLLDLRVAAAVRSARSTSPSPSGSSLAPVSGGPRETNFSPSRLVWRISAIALSGSSTSLRSCEGDLGGVALELDLGHLADADVVDLDRGLRHQVEDVLELDLHRDRVVADVGATGQRQLVDVEVAPGEHDAADERGGDGAHEARHPAGRGGSSLRLHESAEGQVELLVARRARALR